MIVLEQDGQRNVLRLVVSRGRHRYRDLQLFVAFDLACGVADGSSSRFYRAASNQCFEALARKCWNGRSERAVEAPAGMGGLQAHVDRPMTPHFQGNIWVSLGNGSMARPELARG